MKHNIAISILVAGAMLALVGCGQQAPVPSKPESKAEIQFQPTASLQQIMTSIIDPNIDYVWNSVTSVTTKEGTEDKKPVTDEDWKLVKQHALVVLEASNLLLIDGRHVAAEGSSTSTVPAELGAKEIEKLIEANRRDFNGYSHALHEAVQQTIVAIDAKNVDALVQAGGEVDRVCEACHKQFWYPGDKRPTSMPSSAGVTKKS
jgi:mevalonate kinase